MKYKIILFACLINISGFAQKADTLKYCLTSAKVGVGGFDVVAYFKSNKPEIGNNNISTRYEGVEYLFSSDDNKKEFIKNPSKYLPQFGGWCSMTLAMGRATTPTYNNFLVSKGKLFLFERTLAVNGRELWLTDPKGNAGLALVTYEKHLASGDRKK